MFSLKERADSKARMEVLLADLTMRTEEIRLRIDHEQRSYLAYFTTLIAVVLALAAADRFGELLSIGFQNYLPTLVLLLALFLLWLPLDAINEQLRIRLLALYIERELRPQIIAECGGKSLSSSPLRWEKFQSTFVFPRGVSSLILSPMLTARAVIGYVPSLLALLYYSLGIEPLASADLEWIEITLLVLWPLVGAAPIVLAVQLSRSKKFSFDHS